MALNHFQLSTVCRCIVPQALGRTRIVLQSPIYRSVRYATHAAAGRANGPKTGPGKRLGAKKTDNEYVVPGNIIFRQRGTHWFPGENVGMGRDHTIFALESGFVKYYRDRRLHPKRKYIGIAFERRQMLPSSPASPRQRRLGMMQVTRSDHTMGNPALTTAVNTEQAVTESSIGSFAVQQTRRGASPTIGPTVQTTQQKASGRVPYDQLQMWPDYSYRESNWQIGRAPERSGILMPHYRKRDRFLAWRKRSARKASVAKSRVLGRPKSSANLKSKGQGRKR